MNISELIRKNRSYRRFDNSKKLDAGFMDELIEAARISQSAANAQPLRYVTVSSPEKCAEVYPHLRWAGRFKDWDGPEENERPTGYVAVLADTESKGKPQVDSGLSMQNMCLTAMEKGVGSCMIGNIVKKELCAVLDIPERYELLWVIAFGYPVENVILEDQKGDLGYHRDEQGNHYVPKYTADEVLVNKF